MHHQRVTAAQSLQYPRLDADQVVVEHAQQLVFSARGIGERAEDVEQRAYAQLLAHRRGMLHCAVMAGREHEADSYLANGLRHLLRV